jgi:hypothetical protein
MPTSLWRLEMNTTSEVISMIREMAAAEVSEERFVRVMQIGDVVRPTGRVTHRMSARHANHQPKAGMRLLHQTVPSTKLTFDLFD